MLAGQRIEIGVGYSTIVPDMDFETYSEAGYELILNKKGKQQWTGDGLSGVGASAYSEHASTEVIFFAYDLKDGKGERLWTPDMPNPQELFDYIASGQLVEAWYSMFEYLIWNNVCVKKYGWPPLAIRSLLDASAKAQAHAVPGKLANAAIALGAPLQKDKAGKSLIKIFSCPHTPTIAQPQLRILPEHEPEKHIRFGQYCVNDIKVEAELSERCPDLSPREQELFWIDQEINDRGIALDMVAIENCISVVNQAFDKYDKELETLTFGFVCKGSETARMKDYMEYFDFYMPDMTKDTIDDTLNDPIRVIPPTCRRILELRQTIGSAAVKKLFSMRDKRSADDRMRGLFSFCGAQRTGRFAGRGTQPQNMPNSGPKVRSCGCGAWFGPHHKIVCPACGAQVLSKPKGWNPEAVEYALVVMATRSLATVEWVFGDAVPVISGCLRGLFIAKEGYELICSDYSAIEAVVAACLTGEQWRIDVFNDHAMIYEMSASKISGVPFQEFLDHKARTGEHHPLRKTTGKVSELASAYQGGIKAWKRFGADEFMSDPEIKAAIKAWRGDSPMIVNMWYGLERAAVKAIEYPGQAFHYRDITFGVKDDILYLRLPSGRHLSYHAPRLHDEMFYGRPTKKITYMGFDSYSKKWIRLDTYGGKLFENVCQAVARDIFTFAMENLEKNGYPIVLHTHDEMSCEVPIGTANVEQFENIMSLLPAWCADWPIRVAGGWIGKRYRKD